KPVRRLYSRRSFGIRRWIAQGTRHWSRKRRITPSAPIRPTHCCPYEQYDSRRHPHPTLPRKRERRAQLRRGRNSIQSRQTLNPRYRRPDLRKLAPGLLPTRQGHGIFVILGQAKPDHIDPATADAARDKNDGIQHKLSAFLGRTVEMNVEIIRQRQLRLLFFGRYAVDLGQFAEC